jgi:hypothetical protein
MGEGSQLLPGPNDSAASSHHQGGASQSETRAEPIAVVETAFMKLVGRRPSEEERQRLYRLRDGLALKDNDAIWSIIMALDHYDALYRLWTLARAPLGDRRERLVGWCIVVCCALAVVGCVVGLARIA